MPSQKKRESKPVLHHRPLKHGQREHRSCILEKSGGNTSTRITERKSSGNQRSEIAAEKAPAHPEAGERPRISWAKTLLKCILHRPHRDAPLSGVSSELVAVTGRQNSATSRS